MIWGSCYSLLEERDSTTWVETTDTDEFCASCHVMKPFRTIWKDAVHGGKNRHGFAAQCVDCHLPHGNFIEYLVRDCPIPPTALFTVANRRNISIREAFLSLLSDYIYAATLMDRAFTLNGAGSI
jgi:hypothetical protein